MCVFFEDPWLLISGGLWDFDKAIKLHSNKIVAPLKYITNESAKQLNLFCEFGFLLKF